MSAITAQTLLRDLEAIRVLPATAAIAMSDGLGHESVRRMLAVVCANTGGSLGQVYLVDGESPQLRPTDLRYSSDVARFARLVEITVETAAPVPHGLPGRIAAAGRATWVSDLRADPRAAVAASCGIRAGFGFPIMGRSGIEGVAEFFHTVDAQPEQLVLDVLSHVGFEMGHVLEHARARDALRGTRARLAEAARLGRIGTWLYRVEKDRLEWSDELRAVYQVDSADLPSTLEGFLARVHLADVDRVRTAVRSAIETRAGFHQEFRLGFRADEMRWCRSRGELSSEFAGETVLVGFCQDIAEQRQSEEAVRHSRARLAEAERMAHLGSWSWDFRTNRASASDEILRILGIDPAQAPTTLEPYLDRVHADDRGRVHAALVHTATTHDPFDIDCRIVRPDGSLRWIHARAEVVEEAGTARVVGFSQDITDRKRAEEERARLESQLHQSQRLESLGQLAGGVAHDFNNLFSAILSYASFVGEELTTMAGRLDDPSLGTLLSDVGQIQRAAQEAADLTRRLLAFGRREIIHPVPLLVNTVVQDLEDLLRRTLGSHIELKLSLAADLWPVRADPGRLEEVLVNLSVNSRDAMPYGGKLAIETANVHVEPGSASPPGVGLGPHVKLVLTDTGAGMTAAVAERAFEPFFTTRPTGKGSGLGLATVHGIVTQAGGAIQLESAPGAGTTVTILLPATDDRPGPSPPLPANELAPRGDGQTVLVVDDERALRDIARRLLLRNGYSVLIAEDGARAIEVARSHDGPLDVLLTDVIMPGMLGKEVAAAIEALRPGIRVIYMSGYARTGLTSDGVLPAGVLLLEKPFSERDFLGAVRIALEGGPRSPGQR